MTDVNAVDLISAQEPIIIRMKGNDETKHFIRHKAQNEQPPNQKERNIVRGLRTDAFTMVLSADKGRFTVIINTSYYLQQVATLLNDDESYRRLSTNPLTLTTNQINKLLDHLRLQNKNYSLLTLNSYDHVIQL